jgi:hypothetical protein
MAEQEEDMKRKRILLTVIHGQMIVNFVFSKSLAYLFIPTRGRPAVEIRSFSLNF